MAEAGEAEDGIGEVVGKTMCYDIKDEILFQLCESCVLCVSRWRMLSWPFVWFDNCESTPLSRHTNPVM